MGQLMENLEGGVTAPIGFRATGVSCGLKAGGYKDFGIVVSEVPCVLAAAFTSNKIKAAPVLLDMERAQNLISAIVVNSANANCLTGEQGEKDAREMVDLVEEKLELEAGQAMVASTGIIGKPLNMSRIRYGIEKIANAVRAENNWENFSHAIMTTDTRMKNVAFEFELNGKKVHLGVTAKGSGMIKPDLNVLHATMLVFISTDVAIEKKLLQAALEKAIELSFNRISVDNDTSTNDSVFLLSNGQAENEPIRDSKSKEYDLFKEALIQICQKMGKLIVKDGEGATKLVYIRVIHALTVSDAEKIARVIADSFLVKTAIFGNSPNWGRIMGALGYSKTKFDPQKVKLMINELLIFENGEVNRQNESKASAEMIPNEVNITVDLGLGHQEFFVWTSDLTYDYVKINAHYMS